MGGLAEGLGRLRAGTCGWSYKDWVGPFYAPGTAASAYLRTYAERFDTVEVDSTFYGTPRITTVEGWERATPAGFLFCPKVPRTLTHDKRLAGCEREWREFVATMAPLAEAGKLGPIVLQFDFTFEPVEMTRLADFLAAAAPLPLAVEVRHRSWLGGETGETFLTMLAGSRTALVCADLHYMPRLAVATAGYLYVRLLGKRDNVPDDFSHVRSGLDRTAELGWWSERIAAEARLGRDIFVFANNRYQGHAPETVRRLLELLAPKGIAPGDAQTKAAAGTVK